jgi:hypothetical protein
MRAFQPTQVLTVLCKPRSAAEDGVPQPCPATIRRDAALAGCQPRGVSVRCRGQLSRRCGAEPSGEVGFARGQGRVR